MPVNLTNMDIGTRYALQEDFDNGFVGRDRQVVIQTDDPKGYRPVIMDGKTTGGKSKVALVADLTDYLPKANPAFTGTLSGTNGTFTGTLSVNEDPVATQSELNDSTDTKVNKTGDRGQLAGYETANATVTTVNDNTQDAGIVNNSVTLQTGTNGVSWVKIYKIESTTLNVTLGSGWVWANNEAPEINQYDFLVCAWIGNVGFASIAKRSA